MAADTDGRIIGFSCAGPFRPRWGYSFTVEDSVYVEKCAKLGLKQMVAMIGDSENAASIKAHEAVGFGHDGKLGQVTENGQMLFSCSAD